MNWKKQISFFLTSQAVTLFGSSIVQFAIVWFVTKETSSGFWVSMLTVCAYLPQFIVSLFAGVWADRHSKKLLIIGADAAIAFVTLVLALLFPYIENNTFLLSILLLVSAIRSVGTGIQTPAVSAVAGLILTFSTLRFTLMIDIITAVVGISIFGLVLLPKKEGVIQNTKSSVFSEMLLGMRYANSEKFLKRILIINGIFIFLCVPAGFLAALFVSRNYGDSYAYLTTVELVGFAGMTVGGILMGTWGGFKSHLQTLMTGMLFFGMLVFGPLSDVLSMRWIMVFSGIALIGLAVYTSRIKRMEEK